jgi:hypothetical protein
VRWSLSSGSLLRLRAGRQRIDLFPLWPLLYLGAVAAVIVLTLHVIDRRVLPRLERSGTIATDQWLTHGARIAAQRYALVPPAAPDPVWSSVAFPVAPEKTKAHRILVLGDSFAYGSGLANINDVWWRQLQRELERRGYHDVEVIAAAREGASTARELEFARQAVPRYHPDLLLWGYVTNDPDEGAITSVPPVPHPSTPRFDAVAGLLEKQWPRVTAHLRELRRVKAEESAARDGWFGYPAWELKLLSPANLVRYQATLREVRKFQDEQRLPGFFVALPHRPEAAYFEPRYRPVVPLFAKAGLEFQNDLPALVREFGSVPPIRLQSLPTDTHPGAPITHFHAVQVADLLERRFPEILGAKSAGVARPPHVNDWLPAIIDPDRSEEPRGVIAFDYPAQEWQLPFMPGGRPYVLLSLERPVALRQIRAEGANLKDCDLTYTSLGIDGYDDGTARGFSAGRCTLDLSGRGTARTVNSIRISATMGAANDLPVISGRERIAVTGPFTHVNGVEWVATLPANLALVADTQSKQRSTLQLFENGRRLGPGHSLHDQVALVGAGRYSHWGPLLFFSTSDNSDPNGNGRAYEIDVEKITSHPRRIRLTLVPAGAAP